MRAGSFTGADPETAPLPHDDTAAVARSARARRASRSARPGAKRITKRGSLYFFRWRPMGPGTRSSESYANGGVGRVGTTRGFPSHLYYHAAKATLR